MSDEIKQCIVEKAQKLFYQYGIRSITMDFIASELGMSKRTLYENFKNKDSLIVACMALGRQAQERDMTEIFNSDANIIEKLVRCYSRIIYYLSLTSRSFQLDVQQMHSKVNEERSKYRQRQFEYIRKILAMGVAEGVVRDDLDLDIVTRLHNTQMNMFPKMELEDTKDMTLADILGVYTKIFLYGIVTEKGRKILDECYEQITINNITNK